MPHPAIPLKRALLQDAADRKHTALRELTDAFHRTTNMPGDAAGIEKVRKDLELAERAFVRAHLRFRDTLVDEKLF